MGKRVLFLFTLVIILVNFSSCRMHEARPRHNYFQATRTSRHWGASRHPDGRHRFWGHHRYGPRPYRHKGMFRF